MKYVLKKAKQTEVEEIFGLYRKYAWTAQSIIHFSTSITNQWAIRWQEPAKMVCMKGIDGKKVLCYHHRQKNEQQSRKSEEKKNE